MATFSNKRMTRNGKLVRCSERVIRNRKTFWCEVYTNKYSGDSTVRMYRLKHNSFNLLGTQQVENGDGLMAGIVERLAVYGEIPRSWVDRLTEDEFKKRFVVNTTNIVLG